MLCLSCVVNVPPRHCGVMWVSKIGGIEDWLGWGSEGHWGKVKQVVLEGWLCCGVWSTSDV